MTTLPRFELEDWFRTYAFRPEMINLSPSGPASPSIGELLGLAKLGWQELEPLVLDYSETEGSWTLRQALTSLYAGIAPEEIIVTSGAVEAIALTLAALVEPGTRVVLESPIYGSYEPLLRRLGAEVTRYELSESDGYCYDFDRLERLVREQRAELLVVNPYNNPTGRGIASVSALSSLGELSRTTGCRLLSDEVFRLASLEGPPLPSAIDEEPGGLRAAIAIGDMTKPWGLGGLRIGWLACHDEDVRARALNARDYTTNSNSVVSERLAEIALSVRDELLAAAIEGARETVTEIDRLFSEGEGTLSWHRPAGGYCGLVKIDVGAGAGAGGAGAGGPSILELCGKLAERKGYLFLPGAVFGSRWQGHVRIGLAAGADRLASGLTSLLEEAGRA